MRTFLISPSALNTAQTCLLKYHYAHNLRLNPIDYPTYMDSGTMMHKMLEAFYRTKMDKGLDYFHDKFSEIVDEAIQAGEQFAVTGSQLADDNILENVKVFKKYAEYYKDEQWIPLAVEQEFTRVLWEDEDFDDGSGERGLRIALTGKIDLVVQQDVTRIVVDHKKVSRRSDPHPLGNQLRSYMLAADCFVAILNQVGTQKTVQNFHRPSISWSPEQAQEFIDYTVEWALEMHMANVKNRYPMNPTGCDKFNGCMYTEICAANPESRNFKVKALFGRGDLNIK